MEPISEKQLFRSCEILFGPQLDVSRQFLDYLQMGGVKSAYRQRAMETHPDRLIGLDPLSLRQGIERFHAVQEAYELLRSFVKTKTTGPETAQHAPDGGTPAATRPWPEPRDRASRHASFGRCRVDPIVIPEDGARGVLFDNTERYYQGPLPRRPLLFGHFLYYSGLANWRTIARILTWQRIERPRLGELGRRFGMCRQEDVTAILQAKKPFSHFGETARMLGILSARQVNVLMFHQQRMQKKFGAILVERKLINETELQELLVSFERHNAALRPQ